MTISAVEPVAIQLDLPVGRAVEPAVRKIRMARPLRMTHVGRTTVAT
jgi:hypothetical protein